MSTTPLPLPRSGAGQLASNPAVIADVSRTAADSYRARPLACPTLDQYGKTLAWTLLAVAVCGLGYLVEKYVFYRGGDLRGIGLPIAWAPLNPLENDAPYRLFKNPAELPMRVFGIPHFLIGLLFMLSSRRMRGPRSLAWLAVLAAISAAFCWAFFQAGAHENPLALLFFYFYFLIHGFRDEAFFYKSFGDMPREADRTHDRLMVVLQLLFLGLMAALIIPGYVLYGEYKPEFRHPALEAMFPADWPYVVRFLSLLVPMLAIGAFALRRIGRSFPDGLAGLWYAHRPILIIFLMSSAIILLPLATGPWTFNVVVLMHFVAWFFFGRNRFETFPPKAPPRNTWQWMRTTPAGFTALHLGLAAVIVALLVAGTYVLGKAGPIEAILGSKTFYYWTIVHVTLSFFPRN